MGSDSGQNLTSHRAAQSVWDRRGWQGVTIEERVGPWLVALGGLGMLVSGATRRSKLGAWFVVSGVGLIACAAAGLCNPREASIRWRHLRQRGVDRVTIESMHSFPASDAPSSNAVATSVGLRR
jgi:hypothetical protein